MSSLPYSDTWLFSEVVEVKKGTGVQVSNLQPLLPLILLLVFFIKLVILITPKKNCYYYKYINKWLPERKKEIIISGNKRVK